MAVGVNETVANIKIMNLEFIISLFYELLLDFYMNNPFYRLVVGIFVVCCSQVAFKG